MVDAYSVHDVWSHRVLYLLFLELEKVNQLLSVVALLLRGRHLVHLAEVVTAHLVHLPWGNHYSSGNWCSYHVGGGSHYLDLLWNWLVDLLDWSLLLVHVPDWLHVGHRLAVLGSHVL